ncbi:hypothetical protein [Rhizobium phage RHph_X2_24]|nr:hypothetical protein [Rhizobium phage RHph_X2_24]
MIQGKWKQNTGRFASGEIYVIGKIKVGSWFNPSVARGDPTICRAAIDLPGIALKAGTTDFSTPEQARERVERAVATWFSWLEQ